MGEGFVDLNANYEEVEDTSIPDDIPLPMIADEVVRGKRTLTPPQMRLLIELLPYHLPKLSATANISIDGAKSFAEALERACARSENARSGTPLLINGPVEELPPTVANRPFVRAYRRF